MKTNRMFEIIMILLNEGEVKAKDLAERFNCTTKTIYRDVEYIKDSGIPIISELGRNGGFKLGAGFSKNNKNLSLKEQHTIIKALKDHGRLPEEQLDEIMTTIEGLFKDDSIDWIDVEFKESKLNNYFYKLREAIITSKIVGLSLIDKREGEVFKIEPYQILLKNGCIYLKYFDLSNKNLEEIIFDRIYNVEVLEQQGFIKRKFDK